jgi:hypothetical protein
MKVAHCSSWKKRQKRNSETVNLEFECWILQFSSNGVLTKRVLSYPGEDGVTLGVVAKLVKWAYCYRQWEFFDCWLPRVLAALLVNVLILV